MTRHSCIGTGAEISKAELEAIGRAELVASILKEVRREGHDKDPLTLWKWFQPRPGIDQETRVLVRDTLFPQKRKARTVTSARPVSFRASAAAFA
ncbi:MAG: hypothetical protein IH625_14150 [Rhodobacteraceae bacterium]|nr:hypothetical protein [Paracoccaceae bacterium]